MYLIYFIIELFGQILKRVTLQHFLHECILTN